MERFPKKFNEWKQNKYCPEAWKAALEEAREHELYLKKTLKNSKPHHSTEARRAGMELLMFQKKYLAEQEEKNV